MSIPNCAHEDLWYKFFVLLRSQMMTEKIYTRTDEFKRLLCSMKNHKEISLLWKEFVHNQKINRRSKPMFSWPQTMWFWQRYQSFWPQRCRQNSWKISWNILRRMRSLFLYLSKTCPCPHRKNHAELLQKTTPIILTTLKKVCELCYNAFKKSVMYSACLCWKKSIQKKKKLISNIMYMERISKFWKTLLLWITSYDKSLNSNYFKFYQWLVCFLNQSLQTCVHARQNWNRFKSNIYQLIFKAMLKISNLLKKFDNIKAKEVHVDISWWRRKDWSFHKPSMCKK